MPIIVYSETCLAGKNIAEHLKRKHGFTEGRHEKFKVWGRDEFLLVEVPTKLAWTEDLDEYFATDFYVFASKHKSESKKPCLTVHTCGNWGANTDVGGREREVSVPAPTQKKIAFRHLASNPIEGFEVVEESTHHGPTTLRTPLFFIEIGSTEKEWLNEKAGELVADAIMEAVTAEQEFKIAIGAGGTHYCPSFTKLELESDFAFSHIIANYAIEGLDEKTFLQALEKGKPEILVLDWKGLKGKEREKLIGFAKNANLPYKSDKELRKK